MLEQFATIVFFVQLVHSVEELTTGFNKKWYLFKMPFWIFLVFEILHNLFWATVIFVPNFPSRNYLLVFFLALMFANGVQHIVWWGNVKKYVPGLITAPILIFLFLVFFYKIVLG